MGIRELTSDYYLKSTECYCKHFKAARRRYFLLNKIMLETEIKCSKIKDSVN